MTELQKCAYEYKEMGWNLIPLYGYSKIPRISWKKYQTERMTDEDFNSWINDPNITGIGVVTGQASNLTVIDEDCYKQGGVTLKIMSTVTAKTCNGGRHHYFQYNNSVASVGFKTGVNVEIKSAGGFIVCPPSKAYKKDGKTIGEYVWEVNR